MKIRMAIFVGTLLAGLLAGQSAYIGALACRGCHADIYKKQEVSGHARSLRPPAEIAELTAQLPFQKFERSSGATLVVRRAGDGSIEMAAQRAGVEDLMTLAWAFGSGTKGITSIGRLAGGGFAESRLTWYASLKSFDLTTGAAKLEPKTLADSLGRPLRQEDVIECFGCHSTGGIPEGVDLARGGMGVRCERCHGPGQEHVRAMQQPSHSDKKILHPGKLDGFRQAQMCGVCHGRPPEDSDLQAIRMIQAAPNSVRFPSQRIVLSRCFNESEGGIRCSTCHDPHTDGPAGLLMQELVCGSCHRQGAKSRVKICPVAKDNCVSCHMKKEQVMANSVFTDHWIRVVREEQTP